MSGAVAATLPDGRRLHLQHGPIDIITEVFGVATERAAAYDQAIRFFDTILVGLMHVLPDLRKPVAKNQERPDISESITGLMTTAIWPHRQLFVTPMAAVAGAVADAVLREMVRGRSLERAYVNNGGDISIHLTQGQQITVAAGPNLGDRITLVHDQSVRGVATSGWRGRSFSLGIADAVTVLAKTAADADVAATLIANAVDLPGHPEILRQPASERDPDSELGSIPVTVGVGHLTDAESQRALEAGLAEANRMKSKGLIQDAALWLAGNVVSTGPGLISNEFGQADADRTRESASYDEIERGI